ncbi:MAG: glycoside hydrolase family 65, partial [Clostridiales bacterium]|nr:glycoside hydrolase family 65 [Clostridiales bacterium]
MGNGEFAFTCDVTGLQTLYDEYCKNLSPLTTMSQWGWHITPVSEDQYAYTNADLEYTEYDYAGRRVSYAVEKKPGNEDVYYWLRKNPHKFNLGRLGFLYNSEKIKPEDISDISQTLNLYEGVIESRFKLDQVDCKVRTSCHFENDAIAVEVESELLAKGLLTVQLVYPYGSPDISGGDWDNNKLHESKIINGDDEKLIIERNMDKTRYFSCLKYDKGTNLYQNREHDFRIEAINKSSLSFSLAYYSDRNININENIEEDVGLNPCKNVAYIPTTEQIFESSINGWKSFWETGGIVDLHKSSDPRALELERRIVLSQYQSRVNCIGSMPPQETGLICNSWHGKFHLEMYLWHQAYIPLWNHTELMEPCFEWYLKILPQAKANASRNGFKGAKWPKQVAYDGIDSPSPIATLLIWQQPHIIYMLELAYQSEKNYYILQHYWILVKKTADYMVDLVVYNKETEKYDLVSPVIPAQEAHDPKTTHNPIFEVEYWRFTLLLAGRWAKRLKREEEARKWLEVANNMADLPTKDELYLAHEKCPTTYEEFN